MAVYGYIRVSTHQQAEHGLSLEAQERQLDGYAMMHNFDILTTYSEKAVSGWTPLQSRPQGKALMDVLQEGDIVLCPKLDRMFRSAKDALDIADELKRRKVSLHLLDLGGDVTGNGVSKVFFTIVAAFAEFERDRLAERIADVKANERKKGRFLGGSRPFGFRVRDGRLVPDEDEQKKIEKIRQLREEGGSYRSIAEDVSEPGNRISHVTVRRILKEAP